MNYNHLTISERACVYQFKQMGLSIRKIAEALNRSPSTISRELKRNYCGYKFKYLPHIAQDKYEKRRKVCHRKTMVDYKQTMLHFDWMRWKDCFKIRKIVFYVRIISRICVPTDNDAVERKGVLLNGLQCFL